jgi:hypothetical protein|tara:strand:- start:1149 stop:1376 length:228 start_codon:yes stop_codon:yes gene_type:complete
MDDLEKQKRTLNKIIGKRSKVQVYDRSTKTTKMVPKSNSNIKSAKSKGNQQRSSSFSKKKSGGCGGCSRKRKTGN